MNSSLYLFLVIYCDFSAAGVTFDTLDNFIQYILDNFINSPSDFSGSITPHYRLMKGCKKECTWSDTQHWTSVLSTSKIPNLRRTELNNSR